MMSTSNLYSREIDKFSFTHFVVRIIPKTIQVLIGSILFTLLLPIFWIGCLLLRRPPNVPYLSNALRYLKLSWTVSPENPAIPI